MHIDDDDDENDAAVDANNKNDGDGENITVYDSRIIFEIISFTIKRCFYC
jgi:hypothetical protein